jgi:1-acyl-sn-glycerol-3-phosphate acyltransferase
MLRSIFRLIFSVIFRWRIIGQENIPLTGGVIIAPNHTSNIDPPLVGSAMRRRVTVMAKKELFSSVIFAFIIKRLGAFPINRGSGDRAAIKMALSLLNEGRALLLFPEGTRSKTGNLGKPQAGVSMMAIKSQVPVVPVAVSGTYKFFRNGKWFPRFTVRFGKPVYPPEAMQSSKEAMEEFSGKIMNEINNLLKQDL